MTQKLIEDETYYDAKLAGYWIWAASCWIGSGLTILGQRPQLSNVGTGVHKIVKRPHLSSSYSPGGGVHKHVPKAQADAAIKELREPYNETIYAWFRRLSERLRYVRIVCGDWMRVCGGNWQDNLGLTGVFLDPPYSHDAGRDNRLYDVDEDVAKAVAKWAFERGSRPTYRIVLAGYEGEHDWLEAEGWRVVAWKTGGGYAKLKGEPNANRFRERLWLSPNCLKAEEAEQYEITFDSDSGDDRPDACGNRLS